jgi:tricorn protease
VTVPAEKGDPRNLTNSAGVHDRSPAWSPDGKTIAFMSDAGSEYRLHLAPQDGKGDHRVITLDGAGYWYGLEWSPDSKKIAYVDNSQSVYVLDVASCRASKAGSNRVYTPQIGVITYNWSPDSRWLAYTVQPHPLVSAVYVYDTQNGRSSQVTDGLSNPGR